MLKSCTRLAATSSWVDSGLDATRTRSAPPAWRVRARLAVSAVTCRQGGTPGAARGVSRAAHPPRRGPPPRQCQILHLTCNHGRQIEVSPKNDHRDAGTSIDRV